MTSRCFDTLIEDNDPKSLAEYISTFKLSALSLIEECLRHREKGGGSLYSGEAGAPTLGSLL